MEKAAAQEQILRLEKLKQATIINYFSDISFSSEMALYDSMIHHLFYGDFDDIFESSSLIGVDFEERTEIFKLVRKYKNICFFQGNVDCWSDSVEGVSLNDLDFVCMKLLDNYDFLLKIAKDGGERVLNLLFHFQDNYELIDGSLIDHLRNTFVNDDVLKTILIEMSKAEGKYSDLSTDELVVLCMYPEGILYDSSHEKVRLIPPKVLISKINDYVFGVQNDEYDAFLSLRKLFSNNDYLFEDVIFSISHDSQSNLKQNKKK